MQFSYSAIWDDTVRMLRASTSLLLAVAGVFLFLPALVLGVIAPQPTGEISLAMMMEYVAANWPLLLLVNLIGITGNLAILTLVLDEGRPTVGAAIRSAFMLLPFYFLASIVSGFLIFLGTLAFILPGFYAIGRLAVLGPVMVAEGRRQPIDAVRRTLALTKRRGWAILGLILLVVIAFYIVNMAVTAVLGSIFLLIDRAGGGPGIGAFLLLILESALGAIFSALLIVLVGSIYRRLTSGT